MVASQLALSGNQWGESRVLSLEEITQKIVEQVKIFDALHRTLWERESSMREKQREISQRNQEISGKSTERTRIETHIHQIEHVAWAITIPLKKLKKEREILLLQLKINTIDQGIITLQSTLESLEAEYQKMRNEYEILERQYEEADKILEKLRDQAKEIRRLHPVRVKTPETSPDSTATQKEIRDAVIYLMYTGKTLATWAETIIPLSVTQIVTYYSKAWLTRERVLSVLQKYTVDLREEDKERSL
jgi:chromosome segregation ATPase